VTDRKSIAANYLKGWFWVDILSSIPFDTLFQYKYSSIVSMFKVCLRPLAGHTYSTWTARGATCPG
jgi:hypothetical protein